MIGTISIKLTNVTVSSYFPPPLNLRETLIADGIGALTVSFYPPPSSPTHPTASAPAILRPEPLQSSGSGIPVVWRGLRYYLQVTDGKRANALRLGQAVNVTAYDDEKNVIQLLTQLETISTGTPAVFSGPLGISLPLTLAT